MSKVLFYFCLPRMESKSIYSSIAGFYDVALGLSGYWLAIESFVREIPYDESDRINVLDAGCGTGLYSFAILKRYPRATISAFDLNKEMVERFLSSLEKKSHVKERVRLFTADLCQPLPAIEKRFDLIVTGGVFEYVEIQQAVKNLSQYLSNGGFFLNTSVRNNLMGKLTGKIFGFRPHNRSRNIDAFTVNGYKLMKTMRFPPTREAYLFQKRA
jgi:SAM-dependent methyltransferase